MPQTPRDNRFWDVQSDTQQAEALYTYAGQKGYTGYDPATGIWTYKMDVGCRVLYVDTTTGLVEPNWPPELAPAPDLPVPGYPMPGVPADIFLPPVQAAAGHYYIIVAVCCSAANPARVFERSTGALLHTFNGNQQTAMFISHGYMWMRNTAPQVWP